MNGAAVAAASASRSLRLTPNILPALIFLVFALLPVVASLTARQYLLDFGARMMVFAVAAVALDLLVGYAGLISFGHAAFVGLGAYTVGILSSHGINDALVALPAAIAVSMLFAWLTGIVCLRTKGAYFIMITLAFGQMVYFVATSLAPYGGDNGLTIAARNTIAGWPLLKSDRAFYYFTFVCLLATYLFCRALVVSRFGRVLRGTKENATRMATIGFRHTLTWATPIAASTPVSRLVSCRPRRSTVSPAVISVPANDTPLPAVTARPIRSSRPRASACSTITTASAPRGTMPPVAIDTALPR